MVSGRRDGSGNYLTSGFRFERSWYRSSFDLLPGESSGVVMLLIWHVTISLCTSGLSMGDNQGVCWGASLPGVLSVSAFETGLPEVELMRCDSP
jgi:hypothetical protein